MPKVDGIVGKELDLGRARRDLADVTRRSLFECVCLCPWLQSEEKNDINHPGNSGDIYVTQGRDLDPLSDP